MSARHALHTYFNDQLARKAYGSLDNPKLTFSQCLNLRSGVNKIALLSIVVGLPIIDVLWQMLEFVANFQEDQPKPAQGGSAALRPAIATIFDRSNLINFKLCSKSSEFGTCGTCEPGEGKIKPREHKKVIVKPLKP